LWTDGQTDRQTDRRTDGQTGIKPIVPSGYTGRGLINWLQLDIDIALNAEAVVELLDDIRRGN
jgi:hypothetical protein